ncbi:hypothetical protein AMTRI_Chr05g58480 [Amborella trichopoda]
MGSFLRSLAMKATVSSSAYNESDGDPAQLYLNIYDLTPVNDYLYWFGLGIYHSGIETMPLFVPNISLSVQMRNCRFATLAYMFGCNRLLHLWRFLDRRWRSKHENSDFKKRNIRFFEKA